MAKNSIYDHRSVEKKWQDYWLQDKLYESDLASNRSHFYNLWMFPYPSAEGLHAGHAFASTGSDIFGRFMRMKGSEVFQPIGYDSFGIHSENFAIKIGQTPQEMLARTTKHYEEQLRALGHGYDWSRTVTTSDIDYYKWTQWLFVEMFKAGLAYKKKASVNFCPFDKTVLADEQVMSPKQAGKEPHLADGTPVEDTEGLLVCERCGCVAEKRELEQWFFKITDYSERLLSGLEKIDWSERVKIAQKEWIGKSKGLEIKFKLIKSDFEFSVWTKFWETVFGITFIVVAPEYAQQTLMEFVPEDHKKSVTEYIKTSLNKSEQQRKEDAKEKTGVFTGIYAKNPVNNREIPVWIADYVLMGVGTGAVMGVPAHDERDFAFARKFKLPIKKVVDVIQETHSVVIKKSVKQGFEREITDRGWYLKDYEGWGWGIVFPKGSESEYIKIVQSNLEDGPWYVHTDGVLKEIIFKDKHFSIDKENEMAKEYARKLGIPQAQIDWDDQDSYMFAHEKGGLLVNSGRFDGLDAWGKGKEEIASWLIEDGFGAWKTTYHLRDWLISRQRYWGPPIPMIYCQNCADEGRSWLTSDNLVAWLDSTLSSDKKKIKDWKEKIKKSASDWPSAGWYPEEALPVELPTLKDYQPKGDGKGPLANHPEFYKTTCPHCGSEAIRETDVSDTFVDSSWYFLRYPSVGTESDDKLPFDPKITREWLPVSLYFGGAEHSVLHLMYARFVTMLLSDLGKISFEEPFPRFFAHGLMIKDGAKMSKSRGNVVNPDDYVKKYGADTLRLYVMFLGPMDGYPDFRDTGIEGMHRFVKRIWTLSKQAKKINAKDKTKVYRKLHQTIKNVTEDIQDFKYNTAIASLMELVNTISQYGYDQEILKSLALMFAPFAPHLSEEIWHEVLGEKSSVHKANWPQFDKKYLTTKNIQLIIQVNGKLRATLKIEADSASNEELVNQKARVLPNVSTWLTGKDIKKTIFIPGKLINFVVN